jgi:hypothetical protein
MDGIPMLLRVTRGLYVLGSFVESISPLLLCLPLVLLLGRPSRPQGLLLLLFAGQAAYSVYVGGDAWEGWHGSNRFISIGMPAFFVLLALAIERVAVRLRATLRPAAQVAALLGAVFWMNANAGSVPLREWLLLERGLNVQGNAKYTEVGLALRDLTTSSASVAVVWAGSTPYFAERTAVDLLGKSDRRIAHEPVRPEVFTGKDPLIAYYPGHSKWDFSYSLGDLRPDAVVGWEDSTIPEGMPDTAGDYVLARVANHPVYLRRDSPELHWEQLAPD